MKIADEARADIRRGTLKRIEEAMDSYLRAFERLEKESPDGIPGMSGIEELTAGLNDDIRGTMAQLIEDMLKTMDESRVIESKKGNLRERG